MGSESTRPFHQDESLLRWLARAGAGASAPRRAHPGHVHRNEARPDPPTPAVRSVAAAQPAGWKQAMAISAGPRPGATPESSPDAVLAPPPRGRPVCADDVGDDPIRAEGKEAVGDQGQPEKGCAHSARLVESDEVCQAERWSAMSDSYVSWTRPLASPDAKRVVPLHWHEFRARFILHWSLALP